MDDKEGKKIVGGEGKVLTFQEFYKMHEEGNDFVVAEGTRLISESVANLLQGNQAPTLEVLIEKLAEIRCISEEEEETKRTLLERYEKTSNPEEKECIYYLLNRSEYEQHLRDQFERYSDNDLFDKKVVRKYHRGTAHRYVFKDYLAWIPEEVKEDLTSDSPLFALLLRFGGFLVTWLYCKPLWWIMHIIDWLIFEDNYPSFVTLGRGKT